MQHSQLQRAFILALMLIPSLNGCEKAAISPPADEDAGEDSSSTPPIRSLQYTPNGCAYEVATPEVRRTGMGQDVFGTDRAIPEHVHVSFAGDATTTLAVNWFTDNETLATQILYGTSREAVTAASDATDNVRGQSGHYMFIANGPGTNVDETLVHEVHICGLNEDTTYYYKVGGPDHWSEVFDVATSPPLGTADAWTLAVSGDSRNNQENAWALINQQLASAGVDLHVFSGDAVFLGLLQTNWTDFFEARAGDFKVQDLMARVPFMSANGNHEGLAVNYVAQFAFPQEVSPDELAQGEEWYSFDYGNAHFVVLNDSVADSSVIAGSQATWLRADLAAVDRSVTPWIIVSHHRSFYTCRSTHSPATNLRTAWQPIFDEFAVDFVVNGHNHVYERSLPIRGLLEGEGQLAAAGPNGIPTHEAGRPSGTIYLVSGGAGAPLYDVSDECPTTFVANAVHHYLLFEFEGTTVNFRALNPLTETVLDSFTYTKE